jgi:hypothetical protein
MILSLFLYVRMAQHLAYAQILVRPRFIHPFYTDRKTSSLYQRQDIYSW